MMRETNVKHFAWNSKTRRWLYSSTLANGVKQNTLQDVKAESKVLD